MAQARRFVQKSFIGTVVVVLILAGRCWGQVAIDAGETSGYPGWTVDLPVSLSISGAAPSSVGHALYFPDPRNVKVAARSDGKPDCSPNANVATPAQFAFWPVGCVYEEDECDTVRALFVDLSGTGPNLPAGELFKCRVRIAGSALPGTYPVQLRDPDAGARGGLNVTASGTDGYVQVLQPPGGGGSALSPPVGNEPRWPAWPALGLIAVGLLVRASASRRLPRARSRAVAAAIVVGLVLVISVSSALAQPVEFVAEGTWSVGEKQGAWRAVVGIDGYGAISGRVGFEGLAVLPEANLLATWSRGAIDQGSLFRPGTILRLGRLRGGLRLDGVGGEFTLHNGTTAQWKLASIKARREKAVLKLATQLLARGEPATVHVTIDDYPAVREARARVRDLARYEWDSEEAEAAYEAGITRMQEAVLQKLGVSGAFVLSRPRGSAQLRLYLVDSNALNKLLSLAEVTGVHDPQVYRLTLAQSLPLIGQPAALARGFDGSGARVAIVDTRVDHLWRASPGAPLAFGNGCTRGVGSTGCAIVAAYDAAGGEAHEEEPPFHGTNVAGIAWSVAPASGIVAVDVFRLTDRGVLAWDEHIAAGLSWISSNWRTYNIAAVNLSLGGEARGVCPSAYLAPSIRALRRSGRIVVAASGNDAWTDRLADPACVPRVVRVGAVYDQAFPRFRTAVCEDVSPTADHVACFSNSALFLSLLAPGAVVDFAGIAMAGTSQATPHVTGAIAAVSAHSRYRLDPADCRIARILKTGNSVTDQRNGLAFPRLNSDAATQTRSNSVGDCDNSGEVETEELERGIAIALGTVPLSRCPRFDASGDGNVTIDELVTGTNIAVFGCAVGPSELV